MRFRVVADHIRSSMMLIGDGVTPGNEGRGYVLRRLLRRAVRSMRLLGYEDPALPELFPVSRDKMAETYTELHRDWDRISTVAFAEEHAFRQTLRTGTTIFDTAATEVRSGGGTVLSGDKAFALHDTYGFPIDLTLEMAAGEGAVGRRGRLPPADGRAARACACRRAGQEGPAGRRHGAYRDIADTIGHKVDFTGYTDVVSEGAVRGHRQRRRGRGVRGRGRRDRAGAGPHARSTPRAVASSPTRASSSSTTAPASRSTTCSRRSAG